MSEWSRIRGASASEIAEIISQRTEMFRDMEFTDASALHMMQRTSEKSIRVALAGGYYHQWFAETSEPRVIGGVAVLTYRWVTSPTNSRPQKAYILNLYVYPEFRFKGIGRRLMGTAIQWCREQGFALSIYTQVKCGDGFTKSLASSRQTKCGSNCGEQWSQVNATLDR
jgi:GNAT superfamily N-acetyltransferase